MSIESPAFENGCAIPRRYTRYGENRQPPLIFDRVPAETISLALLVDDPDAPKGNFTHWVAFNIDPHLSGLVEDSTLAGAQEGLNDSGRIGYTGPFPPSGEHRYYFRLYALDCALDLPSDSARENLIEAIQGHIIAEAVSMGRFAAPMQTIRKKN
jgi:Raf kinase inhibitor-like YbhB/YbcL family protein